MQRTFGWVQDAYDIDNLKRVAKIFVIDSNVNLELRMEKIPRMVSVENGQNDFIADLSQEPMSIPYAHLKGKGSQGGSRRSAPCSGIVQAALRGQRKEYQSDWSADSFLRWGISIGMLCYDVSSDACTLSEKGRRYAETEDGSSEEHRLLGEMFLSYPPVCRIMLLLKGNDVLTKFEIGSQLGFVGENGFTSIPQTVLLEALANTADTKTRNKVMTNTEGTSDKYARTMCAWLEKIGWVEQVDKTVSIRFGGQEYATALGQSYHLTPLGWRVCNRVEGKSRYPRQCKLVLWSMLATKDPDAKYLRTRRAHIINALSGQHRTLKELRETLLSKGMDESTTTIADDITGLRNIGLNVLCQRDGYKIADSITGLRIPAASVGEQGKSSLAAIKDDLREKLTHVDHKYLILVDLGFNCGKENSENLPNLDYELQTAALLTQELEFSGRRLGEANMPDVCVYHGRHGLIVDNKAYRDGYNIPKHQEDAMVRYLEENSVRDPQVNQTCWWDVFDDSVDAFNFAFVSGAFKGQFLSHLEKICKRTNVSGAAISSVGLLLLAEELKSGRLSYSEFFDRFQNRELP